MAFRCKKLQVLFSLHGNRFCVRAWQENFRKMGSGLVGSGSGLVGLVDRGSGIFTKGFDRPKYLVHRVENGTRLTNWVSITVFFRQKFFGLGGLGLGLGGLGLGLGGLGLGLGGLGKIGLGNLFPFRKRNVISPFFKMKCMKKMV